MTCLHPTQPIFFFLWIKWRTRKQIRNYALVCGPALGSRLSASKDNVKMNPFSGNMWDDRAPRSEFCVSKQWTF